MLGLILRRIRDYSQWSIEEAIRSVASTPDEMKRHVRFTEEDERALVHFHAVASPQFPRIADEFYQNIREHPDLGAIVTSEAQVLRLCRSLIRWMEQLCERPRDDDYTRATSRLGSIHLSVGLQQRHIFTATSLLRVALMRLADETMGPDAPAVREALCRAIDLELSLLLESYSSGRQRERDEASRLTDQHYRSAVELARALIIGLDARGNIRLFNREAEIVSGHERSEVMGRPFLELLCADHDPDEHTKILEDAIAGRSARREPLNCVLCTRSGQHRDISWQLANAPLSSPAADGDSVVIFALGRDVTEERAMAARLRQSEKLAAVGTLAAGLAHEIRNPLNGAKLHVTFLARALKRSGADPDSLEAIHVVGAELERLSSLVSEFLDFARPVPLQREAVKLNELCLRVVRGLDAAAAAAGAEIVTELPEQEQTLYVDSGKIEQALQNILQNAVEAVAARGEGRIILRVYRRLRQILIEVEDNGPGLPSPDAPIFDAFYSTKPSGTGLGLAIVHRIVTDHDGMVDVESKPGRTVFRVALPFRPPPGELEEE